MKRSIVVAMAFALLLTIAIVAIPRPVAAQLKGGYVDEIVFSVVDQPQAVIQTSAADIDLYIFRLDVATDVVAAKDDPNVN
ncbi:MAG: hypothetical protein GTO63_06385, partial [Anaerolineae bacterium]|nr:hypothetical protein [Anaerolineae bacterium]NIN94600.1 hypothetical protein [Anaerolineae bacterium]